MNFLWIILATLSGFADIGYNYSTRKALKDKVSVAEFSWWMTAIRSLIFLPAVFHLKDLNLNMQQIFILLGLGAITFTNIQLFMKMHAHTELSLSTIIVRLRMIITPLIAFILINEKLSEFNYLGIFVIFAAVLVVSSPKRLAIDKGIGTSFLFALNASLLTVAQKAAANFAPTSLVILTMSLPTVFLLPLFTKDAKGEIFAGWKRNVGEKFQIAIFSILVAYFFVAALNVGGAAGPTGAIYQGVSALAIGVGIIFLKETDLVFQKILAGILTLLGIFLLT